MTIHALQTISIAMILIISTLMNVSITYNNDIESFSFHLLPPFLNSRTVFWTLMGKNKRSNTAKVLEGIFWWEQCWVKQLIIIIVKLLDSKINYQQHFELIYIYLKENVNIKVMKVSFKIIKHPRTSLRYMYIVMLNEIGAILLIHSFFFYTLLKRGLLVVDWFLSWKPLLKCHIINVPFTTNAKFHRNEWKCCCLLLFPRVMLLQTLTQLQPGTYGLVGSYLAIDLLLIQLIDETFKFYERNNLQNFTYYGKLFLRTLASFLIRKLHSWWLTNKILVATSFFF